MQTTKRALGWVAFSFLPFSFLYHLFLFSLPIQSLFSWCENVEKCAKIIVLSFVVSNQLSANIVNSSSFHDFLTAYQKQFICVFVFVFSIIVLCRRSSLKVSAKYILLRLGVISFLSFTNKTKSITKCMKTWKYKMRKKWKQKFFVSFFFYFACAIIDEYQFAWNHYTIMSNGSDYYFSRFRF